MRTTLDLPDPLFKEVKTRAIQEGVKLKELLAAYIEAGLRGTAPEIKAPAPVGVRRELPVGIARIPGTPLHPAMTNADLSAILEEEDIENYHRVVNQSSGKR